MGSNDRQSGCTYLRRQSTRREQRRPPSALVASTWRDTHRICWPCAPNARISEGGGGQSERDDHSRDPLRLSAAGMPHAYPQSWTFPSRCRPNQISSTPGSLNFSPSRNAVRIHTHSGCFLHLGRHLHSRIASLLPYRHPEQAVFFHDELSALGLVGVIFIMSGTLLNLLRQVSTT